MKKLVYQDEKGGNKEFLLTEKEFLEAMKAFENGGIYFCQRLESGLSKSYLKWFEPPKEDVGSEVFIRNYVYGGKKYQEKVYKKKDGKFWVNGSLGWHQQLLSDEEISKLIPQEDFFNNN